MRPVMNMVNLRFIDEQIEPLVLSSKNKANKGATPTTQDASHDKPNEASRTSPSLFVGLQNRSISGVELVQFKHENSRVNTSEPVSGSTIKRTHFLLLILDLPVHGVHCHQILKVVTTEISNDNNLTENGVRC